MIFCRTLSLLVACGLLASPLAAQLTAAESEALVGDAPADPGPLAKALDRSVKPAAVQAAMRRVADWQVTRIAGTPSQDWTFATLYAGLIAASDALRDPRYRVLVRQVADHYDWTLGPRKAHADDQAIGQSYLALDRLDRDPHHLAALRTQFDGLMTEPDDPAKPVWWWCDALFMAPPVWAGLAAATHDARYLDAMDREWHLTDKLLWDPQARLFFRDASYLHQREKNGQRVFWSRGNGWVMGGLARVLEVLPADDPRRAFYVNKLQAMAKSVARLQGADGLWRPGLLDAADYPIPEVKGSPIFVYAISWGVNHHLLDRRRFAPVAAKGWAGLVSNIYADGRLGSIQPVGAAPGAYPAGASYVFGTGAFLLAGSEVQKLEAKAR